MSSEISEVPNAELHYQLDVRVATITLARAQRKNALTKAHWQDLHTLFVRAQTDQARVLILRSSASVFCAGADIEELQTHILDTAWMQANHAQVQATTETLAKTPLATIAIIEGACVGGGVGLIAACDFRYASHQASFALTPAKLGLSYSKRDMQAIIALIGTARAKELLLSARSLPALQALTFGLIHELHAVNTLHPAVQEKVQQLLACSGHSIAALKQNFGELQAGQFADDQAAAERFSQMFASPDFASGAQAFLSKTIAKFA